MQIRKGSECNHKTCSGGEVTPGKFGGWRCYCYCHIVRRMCENLNAYCQLDCDNCIIQKECEIISQISEVVPPCYWTNKSIDKIVEIVMETI